MGKSNKVLARLLLNGVVQTHVVVVHLLHSCVVVVVALQRLLRALVLRVVRVVACLHLVLHLLHAELARPGMGHALVELLMVGGHGDEVRHRVE